MLAIYVLPLLGVFIWLVQVVRSPISKIPGPWYSNFTSLILKFHELHGNRRIYIHALHQKHGPVVRLGPNEVAFNSLESQKEIYCSGGSGYDKTEFYNLFRQYGEKTMFTTLHKDEHAAKKRRFADRFAMTNILRPEVLGEIREKAVKVTNYCEKAKGTAIDAYVILHCYALDCVSHHLFSPGGLDSLNTPADRALMEELCTDNSLQARMLQYYAPRAADLIAKLSPTRTLTVVGSKNYVLKMTDLPNPSPLSIMGKLHTKTSEMRPIEMSAECMDQMAAGIDTTGDGLCFLMWQLSQPENYDAQEKLRKELLQNLDAALNDLPYLDAVAKEGLRCFPPIPMSLPRYVPKGGRSIEGYKVPGGTIVSCQAWSLNRLEEVFPEAERFLPERWLSEEGVHERNAVFFSFAQGGRGCIGKNLAIVEMKALLREMYLRFRTRPAEEMKADMTIDDQIISSRPKDQTCLMKFELINS